MAVLSLAEGVNHHRVEGWTLEGAIGNRANPGGWGEPDKPVQSLCTETRPRYLSG